MSIGSSCYSVALGACCVNGICTPNRSKTQCASSNGIFHPGITCDSSLCDPIGACCHGELLDQCVGGITAGRCTSEFAGTFNVGEVCSDNPCDSGSLGSCCHIDQQQGLLCIQKTASECALLDNLSFTSGVECDSNSCSGFEVRACCKEDNEGVPFCTTELVSDCYAQFGTSVMNKLVCTPGLCDNGACCSGAACFDQLDTRLSCYSQVGPGTLVNPTIYYPGYACGPDFTCSPLRGRCCYVRVDGTQECFITTESICVEQEGNWTEDVSCEDTPPCDYPDPSRACCYTNSLNQLTCESKTRAECLVAGPNSTPGNWLNNSPNCFPGICECGACCYSRGGTENPHLPPDPKCPVPSGESAQEQWILDRDMHCSYTNRRACDEYMASGFGISFFTAGVDSCTHTVITGLPPITGGPCLRTGCCTPSGCDIATSPPCPDGICHEGWGGDPNFECQSGSCDPGCTELEGGTCACGGIPPGGNFVGEFLNNSLQKSTNIPTINNMANFVNVAVNIGGNTYCVPMITTSPNVELCESSEII